MAGSSLLTLIDDIATLLDDVAGFTKVATEKSAGVLGDDLALNAQQVSGIAAKRELPVIWAVAKGSLVNKAILVPAAIAISALLPWALTPLLMLGGGFLCFEGFEKVLHEILHPKPKKTEREVVEAAAARAAEAEAGADPVAREKKRIKGAIRTDLILSAEVIVIALKVVSEAPLWTRFGALAAVGVLMTVGVYGLVAGIVKLDDLGMALKRNPSATVQALGRGVLGFAPHFMRGLGIVGTAAMFLVGGGILAHNLPPLKHWVHDVAHWGGWQGWVGETAFNGITGIVAGALVVAAVMSIQKIRGGAQSHS